MLYTKLRSLPRTLLTAFAIAVAASGAAALPASAESGGQQRISASEACPFTETLCLFEEEGFAGERFTVRSAEPGVGVCVDLAAHGWGERAASAVNTSAQSAAMFQSDDCTGHPVELPSGPTPTLTFEPNSVFVH